MEVLFCYYVGMIDRKSIEARYHDKGLETRFIEDHAGEVYEPHRHGGVLLFTLGGSARVKLNDAEWQNVIPGTETQVTDNQLHEAVAGPEGWTYIFATTPEEMKNHGL